MTLRIARGRYNERMPDSFPRRTLILTVALAVVATACMPSWSQTPAAPPAGASSRLPPPPATTRLPGIDPRECGTSKWSALCAEGRWARFARMKLEVEVGTFRGTYTIEHTDSGEVHATAREAMDRKVQAGEAVVVSEDAFAYRSRDASTRPDDMLDQIMTSPIVFSDLVAILLEAGLPEGPASIKRTHALKAQNRTQFILTRAPAAAVLYGAPWDVSGNVRALEDSGIAFDLTFRFRPVDASGRASPTITETARLTGEASYADLRARLPDSFDLVGWKLVRSGTVLGAVTTLGEARHVTGAR